ncbi:probable 28S ribosomal protein S25, mitochondrial [Agrilus planipennis]|uniref:Small ribosomal subunit protein mS25 n=1 Tax=Agrilus planipennis TaxID=224129 RepID=A0A1W4WY88_AGRPL|nr:probable 28S ribosomal protein S25, mitochondrial [Agrilus planipennis]
MPFMKGQAPVRRTLRYLEAGKLVLKEQIKVFTVNYNIAGDHHQGAKEFAFWFLPQIQYKNPDVQIEAFKNMTPSPFIRVFYETGHQMLIDCDSKTKEEIHDHLMKVIGKTGEVLKAEEVAREKKDNPANFGVGCEKHCICEIPGQVPCPGIIPVPKYMRGKYKYAQK